MKPLRLLAPSLALLAAFVLPANARTPRIGGDPLIGTYALVIKAICIPADGSFPFVEKSFDTVTISAATATGEGTFTPTITMSEFTVLPSMAPGFTFGSASGARYGRSFYLIGDADAGSIRGLTRLDSSGFAFSFKAVAHSIDAIGIIDAKIKGFRIGP